MLERLTLSWLFSIMCEIAHTYVHTYIHRWGFVHIAQCRGLVTNGSNHWILREPDQASKTETMARGTEVLFTATSDRLPSHPTNKGCKSHRQLSLLS